MKKLQLFLIMLLVGTQVALAQSVQVTGKVTYADDGQPVIGATVNVKGSASVATATDVNGDYKITIPSGANKILVFKNLGLKTQELTVGASGAYNVTMLTDAEMANTVVATAYGVTTKKAFTGTAAVVSSKDIKNMQVTSPTNALQGLAAGVMVVATNGQPGEKSTIRVRGVGTFTSSTTDANAGEPLIIVDGVTYSGNMNSISPNDIESMTVLKDANSTALYGSRAANGVINIVTKSGRKGKARVTANASFGVSMRAREGYDYVGAEDYMKMAWGSIYNDGIYNKKISSAQAGAAASKELIPTLIYNPYGNKFNQPIDATGNVVAGAELLYDQDWYRALTRLGKRQQYDVSVSGGSESTQYLISLGMVSDQGVLIESKFDRYNARAKVDTKITKWLKAGLNSAIAYSVQNYPMQGGTQTSSITSWVNLMANIYPDYERAADGSMVRDAAGNLIPDYGNGQRPGNQPWGSQPGAQKRPQGGSSNPMGTTSMNDISYTRFTSTNNAYMEANFLKHFTLRTQLGVDYYTVLNNTFYNPTYGDGAAYAGLSRKDNSVNTTISWVNTLTYDQTFNDKHHVNVLVGMDSYDYRYQFNSAERRGFLFPGTSEIDYASGAQTARSWKTGTRNMRYMARAAYDYNDRYHFSASLSYDGTSRFAQDSRWGVFYSVGGAWNVSNEKWFSDNIAPEAWNNLKLRASYGTSGNANIGYYPYLSTYDGGWNILGNSGSTFGKLGNEGLTWEKQNQLDVGVDFGFLNGYLNLALTYYNRRSDAILMASPLAPSTGVSSINDNVGAMLNHGLEIELNATIFNRKDINWTAGFNISYLENRVLALPSKNMAINNPSSSYKRLEVGRSAYSWYMPEFAGIDQATGVPLWNVYKTNNNGVEERTTTANYSNATQRIVADALPKWQGGISTNFQWKGLDFGFVASFSIGGKILDTDYAGLMHNFASLSMGRQTVEENKNAWKKPGDITNVPVHDFGKTNSYTSTSDRWLVDASYLRMRNMTVGYNFASLKGVSNAGISNLRLYISADNLFTIFGTKGLDPEQGLDAITNTRSSAMRTVSVGLNIGF